MFFSSLVSAQQFLPVKGIVNARDLGGYVVQGGQAVRDGMLLAALGADRETIVDDIRTLRARYLE